MFCCRNSLKHGNMKEVSYSFYIDKKCEKETKTKCGRKHICDVDLHVNAIANAIILPGDNAARGGVLSNGKLLAQSPYLKDTNGVYEFDETDVVNSDEEVVYIGMWLDVWGHCLTDNLKHLWFLSHPEYDYLKKHKWVYSQIWSETLCESHNMWKLLRKWGVNTRNVIRIEKPTRYKRVYLADESFIAIKEERYYTKEFARLYDNSVIPTPKLEIPIHEKIYFSRTNWGGKDYGEKSIEDAFQKMGYHVISPEKLELDELIYVLRHCKVLATTEGSISHNSLFLNEGTKLVLIRKAHWVNEFQLPINEIKRLQVTIIDSHKSVAVDKDCPWDGPFFLYCGKNLKRFAPEIEYGRFPLNSFLVYLKNTKCVKKLKRICKKLDLFG